MKLLISIIGIGLAVSLKKDNKHAAAQLIMLWLIELLSRPCGFYGLPVIENLFWSRLLFTLSTLLLACSIKTLFHTDESDRKCSFHC